MPGSAVLPGIAVSGTRGLCSAAMERRTPVSYAMVSATDGTVLQTWSNGGSGVPLIISNGLGSPPAAWPAIAEANSGFRAVTWYQRGLGGSERPRDPAAIRIEDHASDLGVVMDAAGMDRALLLGWSVGVNVAFEFAHQHPERVAGILGVAGVPGGSLRAMYGSVGLPGPLREPAGALSAYLLRHTGPLMSSLAGLIPLSHHPFSPSGLGVVVREARHADALLAVLRTFAAHDWSWYSKLVLAAGKHAPMDVSGMRCPVTLLAGRHDSVTAYEDIVAAGKTMPDAHVKVLAAGTHFLPLQYPSEMLSELRSLARRCDLWPGVGVRER
jgi:pimeloyl-ACP methyl ester carboxylesterase